jgi:hypothetical protein
MGLLTGSAIGVEESWLNLFPGLTIEIAQGGAVLQGRSFPAGTVLVVEEGGRLVHLDSHQKGKTSLATQSSGLPTISDDLKSSSPGPAQLPLDAGLPPFEYVLEGSSGRSCPIEIWNVGNPFSVQVGLRSGQGGLNIDVSSNGISHTYAPDGQYDIYFVFSDRPGKLYKGDSFLLNVLGKKINLNAAKGNYSIRGVE